jgi:hypothetical protein
MTLRTDYDEDRYVYRKSKTSPPPLVTNHAVQRWDERGDHPYLTTLDAWHVGLPVDVIGDNEITEARLFAPSDVVLLGVTNQRGDIYIKTCKYRDWLESEGKQVDISEYAHCDTCDNPYRKTGKIIGCRWCQDGLVADVILDSYAPSREIKTWGK